MSSVVSVGCLASDFRRMSRCRSPFFAILLLFIFYVFTAVTSLSKASKVRVSPSRLSQALPLIADLTGMGSGHCLGQLYGRSSPFFAPASNVCSLPFDSWSPIVCPDCYGESGATFPCEFLNAGCSEIMTAVPKSPPDVKNCDTADGKKACRVSRFANQAGQADAVLVSHVGMLLEQFLNDDGLLEAFLRPPERIRRSQVWALRAMYEPSDIYIGGRDPRVLSLFDYTFGSDRKHLHNFQVSYFPNWELLVQRQALGLNRTAVASGLGFEARASTLFLTSNCKTSWGREKYVQTLMTVLPIDSWGRCLNNRGEGTFTRAPDGSDFFQSLQAKKDVLRAYKFVLAFENTLQFDYVTEKLFDAFEAGALPVYFGAPNVADYAPGPQSYIDASAMKPDELAHLLKYLDGNDTAFYEYHSWRDLPAEWIRNSSPLAITLASQGRDPLCDICALAHQRAKPLSVPATG